MLSGNSKPLENHFGGSRMAGHPESSWVKTKWGESDLFQAGAQRKPKECGISRSESPIPAFSERPLNIWFQFPGAFNGRPDPEALDTPGIGGWDPVSKPGCKALNPSNWSLWDVEIPRPHEKKRLGTMKGASGL